MKDNLYIPKRINVGFQKRSDTFTGNLAYIIYYDDKGVLRKEMSWNNWRDHKIPQIELENTPRSGFLFNKGIRRDGYHWGSGRSVIRVYDPRDFEFEVTVDNLIGILMHSDVSKRDIVEECVYAWAGKDLVLLPVNSEIYQSSLNYTAKIAMKFSAKSLVKGYTYTQKRSDEILTYLGYFDWYDWNVDNWPDQIHRSSGKKHVYWDGKNFVTPNVSAIASVNTEEVVENYSTLVENFFKTPLSQPIVSCKIVPEKKQEKSKTSRLFYKMISNDDYNFDIQTYSLNYRDSPHARASIDAFDSYHLSEYTLKVDQEAKTLMKTNVKRYGSSYYNSYYRPFQGCEQ